MGSVTVSETISAFRARKGDYEKLREETKRPGLKLTGSSTGCAPPQTHKQNYPWGLAGRDAEVGNPNTTLST